MRFDPAEEEVCRGGFHVAVMVMLSTKTWKGGEMASEDAIGANLQVSKRVGWGSFRTCKVGLQVALQQCQLDDLFRAHQIV